VADFKTAETIATTKKQLFTSLFIAIDEAMGLTLLTCLADLLAAVCQLDADESFAEDDLHAAMDELNGRYHAHSAPTATPSSPGSTNSLGLR